MTLSLTIATRQSPLALWQAEHVAARLQGELGARVTLLPLSTRGDEVLDRSLSKIGGKGLFVKELEVALEQGQADLAVHSLKDVPMELPQGFELAAVLQREDPADALVSARYDSLEALPPGACVGTSSLRRQAQLLALRPDLRIEALRGNLQTRLRKLDEGQYDAIVLAAAGLLRLGLGERIRTRLLAPGARLPSVRLCAQQQGVSPSTVVAAYDQLLAQGLVEAQKNRGFYVRDGRWQLRAAFGMPDGRLLRAQAEAALPDLAEAERLGEAVAEDLRRAGALV